jgi:chromosome segregation ATPase
MKELLELEQWAENIVANEAVQDRPLARSQDIQYQASREYPDRSPEQALQLYVANKLAATEKMDLDQNRLINSQKRENEKLRRSLQDLSQDLNNHEKQATDTGAEIERLKALSAKLKPAGEIQKQAAKASADKVEAMLADLEKVKVVPGMDEKKYKELSDKVDKIKNNAGNEEIAKVQKALQQMSQQQSIDNNLFDNVMQQLTNTQEQLDAKEARFKKYIEKKSSEITSTTQSHGEELKKYADIVNKYKDDVESFKNYMDTTRKEVANTKAEVDQLKKDAENKMQELEFLSPTLKKFAMQKPGEAPTQSSDFSSDRAFKQAMSAASPAAEPATKLAIQSKKDLQNLEKDSEIQRSYAMAATPTDKFDLDKLDENLKNNSNPEFVEWANKNIPVALRMFFNRYPELESIYALEQVQAVMSEYFPYLYQYDEIDMETMNKFLDFIKNKIKAQPIQPMQKSLFDNLAEAYETSLDKLIGLDYIKTHR